MYGVISGPYFPTFSPNTGKYGPEIIPHLDTFHAVIATEAATEGVLLKKVFLKISQNSQKNTCGSVSF